MTVTTAAAGDLGIVIRMLAAGPSELAFVAAAAAGRDGVVAAVVGEESVLVLFREPLPGGEGGREAAAIAARAGSGVRAEAEQDRHPIEVSFSPENAPDLPLLLAAAGIDRSRFLEQIRTIVFRARFLGFRPGFAYLEGLPPAWRLPRRATPRSSIPSGSFALAGAMAAFYPGESPGGWNLIGRTDEPLWDPDADPPNRIAAGDEVVIVPVERRLAPRPPTRPDLAGGPPIAVVLAAGTAAFAVGRARPERLGWGLSAGGAFDSEAAAMANRNVGNPEEAVAIECALSGPRLRFETGARASWCGARAEISVDGREIGDPRVFTIGAGSLLEVGALLGGARGVLAIAGGVRDRTPRSLPLPFRRGDPVESASLAIGPAHIRALRRFAPREIVALAGPDPVRAAWLELIEAEEWEVSPRSDRAAVRLRSGRKAEGIPPSLPSAGMQFGTVQWHPDGDLVAMGPDHPVTGGYLQPLTVPSTERWKLAQLRPGDRIRWRVVPPPQYA
ncbi:MAG TPA: carboxyltransferase domain-containing protein [Thermoanaerobaculia bacterium]|nr:carboxyltransferase domain-containing protein [Thermoanaerobaculia bacterium]